MAATSSIASSRTYQEAIQAKIRIYSDQPIIRQILEDKVNKIAADKFRNKKAVESSQVEVDFTSAVAEFEALERHVFHITAPPSLTPAALKNSLFPLSINQSILQHSVRPASELLQIARAFTITAAVRGIIPLTVERLVMHNLIRRFVLNFSLKDELSAELRKVIKPLTTRCFNKDIQALPLLRDDLQGQAFLYLQTGDVSGLDLKLIELLDTLKKQATASSSGLSEKQIMAAVAMRAADIVIEAYVKEHVDRYDMQSAPELAGYKALPAQSKSTRRIFMMNGGVASGKSTAQAWEAGIAKKEGIEWEDICILNRDAFKPLLLESREVAEPYRHFFASFTGEEAFLLRDAILREYNERLVSDSAPHLYIDQVSPTIETMRMAGDLSSRGLDLTIIYTPVEAALCMAQSRERETGYSAVTAGVLHSHAIVPTQLLDSLETARKEGKRNIRLKIVANIARGVLAPVVHIDFAKEKGFITDLPHLLSFFHKTHINRSAERFRELYSKDLLPAEQCCLPMVARLMAGIGKP